MRLFLSKVFLISATQIMRSFICNHFHWLIAFDRIKWLIVKIIFVSRVPLEFVTVREWNLLIFLLFVRISVFFNKICLICGLAQKRLGVGVVLLIFYIDRVPICDFLYKILLVLWSSIEGYIFVLIFDSGNYFLPHLGLIPWIIFAIFRVKIVVWLVAVGL